MRQALARLLCFIVMMGCNLVWSKNSAPEKPNTATNLAQQNSQLNLSDAKKRLQGYLQSSSQATQEMKNGYQKLNLVCMFGQERDQQSLPFLQVSSEETSKARSALSNLNSEIENYLNEYALNSRITRLSACRYLPSFLQGIEACEGFRSDSAVFNLVEESARGLIREANQRLDLHDQFRALEVNRCARPGFADRLWSTEQRHLGSILTDLTGLFRSLLDRSNKE